VFAALSPLATFRCRYAAFADAQPLKAFSPHFYASRVVARPAISVVTLLLLSVAIGVGKLRANVS
jgi:hypothetical protein